MHVRRDLIARVQIEKKIAGQLLREVGFIAEQILPAGRQRGRTDRPGAGGFVLDAELDQVGGDAGQSIAGLDLDVAVRVSGGIVGARLDKVALKRRVGIGIADPRFPAGSDNRR